MNNTKFIIGCDPGLGGAISVIDATKGKLAHLYPMPTTETTKSDLFGTSSTKRKVNAERLISLFGEHETQKIQTVVIEKVSASPQMGVTSAFSFGEGYGILIGILSALYPNTPVHFVMSSVWKMRLNVTKDKSLSNELAKQLFPGHAQYFKKKDAGLAESALIAYYGYKYLIQKSKTETE